MKKILITLFSILFLIGIVTAVTWSPSGNMNLKNRYNISNAPVINATTYFGNGSQMTGVLGSVNEANLNVNSSTWWATVSGFVSKFLIKNGNTINVNETELNNTISNREKNWTKLQNYPVACPSGTYLTQLEDSVVCTSISAVSHDNLTVGNLTVTGNSQVDGNLSITGNLTTGGKFDSGGDIKLPINNRIILQSSKNTFSEGLSILFNGTIPQAKPYLGWMAWDSSVNEFVTAGWFGCHYNNSNGDIHQHCSLETIDNSTGTPVLNSKFAITYNSSQIRAEVTFPNSDIKLNSNKPMFFGDTRQVNIMHNASTGAFQIGKTSRSIDFTDTLIKVYATNFDMQGNNIINADDVQGDTTLDLKVNDGTGSFIRLDNDGEGNTIQLISGEMLKLNGADTLMLSSNTSAKVCNSTRAGSIYYDGSLDNHFSCNGSNFGQMGIQDKITFRLGEIIDNLVDGWIRITGNLIVTGQINATDWTNVTITETQVTDLVHTTDSNASTICSGTTTYLDGEGSCDDISSVYMAIAQDDWINEDGDNMTRNLNMTNNNVTGLNYIKFTDGGFIYDNGTALILGHD